MQNRIVKYRVTKVNRLATKVMINTAMVQCTHSTVLYSIVSYGIIPVLFKAVSNAPDVTELVSLEIMLFVATTGSEKEEKYSTVR